MPSVLGKMLLVLGAAIAALGGLLLLADRWVGHGGPLLPGDIFLRRGNTSFYFPLATCIVVSIVASAVLTLAFYIAGHWRQ